MGVKIANTDPKEYTVYYKGTQELNASLGIAGTGPGSKFDGETVVGLTFVNGQPVKASVDAAGSVNNSWTTGKLGATGTVKGKVSFNLDLTNPKNRTAAADVFHSVGMPILPNSGTPGYQNPVDAAATFRDRFTKGGPMEGATITAQQFEGASGKFDVGFFAGDLIAFGAGGSVGMEQLTATNATYYDPAIGGTAQWRRCSSAG